MAVIVAEKHETESAAMSKVYASTMLELMAENSMVTDVEADLGRSLLGPDVLKKMKEDFPGQFIDCGIQESNMVSVSAGLSLMKRIPFCHTFASFAGRRVADQAFMASYGGANVRIVGSDPGIAGQFNGGTHIAFEDVAIYNAIPGFTVIEPTDSVMLKSIMKQAAGKYGMYYIRLFRKNAVKIYEEGSEFVIGKANVLREGRDVTIIAAGSLIVPDALTAADILSEEGIEARVLDMFTLKPIDEEAVLSAASETGAIVTVENHLVEGGLGTGVARILATGSNAPLETLGVNDRSGEVGPVSYLKEVMGITVNDIVSSAKKAITRKR